MKDGGVAIVTVGKMSRAKHAHSIIIMHKRENLIAGYVLGVYVLKNRREGYFKVSLSYGQSACWVWITFFITSYD